MFTSNDYQTAIVNFNANVKAKNQIKVNKLVKYLADTATVELMNIQKIEPSDLNIALYTSEKAIEYIFDITRKTISHLEKNTFSAVKSLVNAQAIDETIVKSDIQDAILTSSKSCRAHVYQRKNRINEPAQVDYTLAALRLMKVIDRTTNKAIECELMTISKERLKNIAL